MTRLLFTESTEKKGIQFFFTFLFHFSCMGFGFRILFKVTECGFKLLRNRKKKKTNYVILKHQMLHQAEGELWSGTWVLLVSSWMNHWAEDPHTSQQVIVLISSPSHISPKSTNSSTVSSLKMILFHDCMKIQEGKAFFHKEAAKYTCFLISNLFMSDRAQYPKEIGKQSILNR